MQGFRPSDFKLRRIIGEGSFGVAQLATHKRSGLDVVIKCLKMHGMSDEEKSAARKEVDVLSSGRLVHPNIIRYYGHYEHQGRINIVMEYADRGDLAQIIQEARKTNIRIPEKQVRHWFVQILAALEFVHR